jgi:radical SAM-linked protein
LSDSKKYVIQLEFFKKGWMKYISHLDLLRLFQRVLRRAEIPVLFSKGFHPIPKIRFERALKLGVESEKEKVFVYLEEFVPLEDIEEKLNKELPEGIRVIKIGYIEK